MPLYYLSFADPEKPEGQQFLGATIIEAGSEYDVARVAHAAGRNPGGEIAIVEIEGVSGRDELPEEGRKFFDRFVPREEVLSEPHSNMFEGEEA